MTFIYNWPTWLAGGLIVGLMVVIAVTLHAYVQRRFPYEYLVKHNDVAGFIIAVVGTLYAVMLAFVVIAVWEGYDRAGDTAQQEVNSLADLYRTVGAYAPRQRDNIRREIHAYVFQMTEGEWPAMQTGQTTELNRRVSEDIAKSIVGYQPKTMAQSDVHAESLDLLKDFLDARRQRINENARGIPNVLWWTLFITGALTIGFSFLIGTEHYKIQLMMTAALTAVIGTMIWLILEFEYPFRGAVSVSPDIWQRLQDAISLGVIR